MDSSRKLASRRGFPSTADLQAARGLRLSMCAGPPQRTLHPLRLGHTAVGRHQMNSIILFSRVGPGGQVAKYMHLRFHIHLCSLRQNAVALVGVH
eukprot:15011297-Alexandrium_andersonii.AAC.1